MSFKQWSALVQLAAQALVAAWLVRDALRAETWPGPVSDVAEKLLWAVLFVIVFSIIANIVVAILVSIARGEEMKDERADERDKAVHARSMRNAYVVLSVGAGGALLLLALGVDPAVSAYALFGALIFASIADAASQLIYYRIG